MPDASTTTDHVAAVGLMIEWKAWRSDAKPLLSLSKVLKYLLKY